jgi:hypothetical protein
MKEIRSPQKKALEELEKSRAKAKLIFPTDGTIAAFKGGSWTHRHN